ncbi:MAG: UV DNA damage repair endonuclease UvsE [Chloroflexota bacterium]|nr:UV DNA damage repair endonuclease UvsE [Dehalococcoidia bacterium]MDW8252517.1 UV DNA damage repair endonuclease UvsE [Chloroflexota bacterium]
MVLRRLGYITTALGSGAITDKSCHLRSATPERLRALIRANLAGLAATLDYNRAIGVRFYRLSSQLIPFASHPVNTLEWWREEEETLAAIGRTIQRDGVRCGMHPGQYTLLTSPDERVTANALADLAWHVRLLRALGLGREAKIVIHGGGAYGDKAAAMRRFVARYRALPEEWREHLVLENDERVYSVADVLAIHEATGIPIVFDAFHHAILPTPGDLLPRVFATWQPEDGPPEVHFSSQAPGKPPGTHADDVDPVDCAAFLAAAPAPPFDCMLECKRKDLALLALRPALAALGIVEREA